MLHPRPPLQSCPACVPTLSLPPNSAALTLLFGVWTRTVTFPRVTGGAAPVWGRRPIGSLTLNHRRHRNVGHPFASPLSLRCLFHEPLFSPDDVANLESLPRSRSHSHRLSGRSVVSAFRLRHRMRPRSRVPGSALRRFPPQRGPSGHLSPIPHLHPSSASTMPLPRIPPEPPPSSSRTSVALLAQFPTRFPPPLCGPPPALSVVACPRPCALAPPRHSPLPPKGATSRFCPPHLPAGQVPWAVPTGGVLPRRFAPSTAVEMSSFVSFFHSPPTRPPSHPCLLDLCFRFPSAAAPCLKRVPPPVPVPNPQLEPLHVPCDAL